MMTDAYVPSRDVASKLRRRMTQWRIAKPAQLVFDTPVFSVCFDDFPASAAREGARILEQHGARGTFYACAGMVGRVGPCGRNFEAGDIGRLAAAGHEIGCHSYAHGDAAQQDVFTTLSDLAKNRDALMAMGARSPRTHAYPYGETTGRVKDGLPPRFACARGVLPGLNAGHSDLAQLRAFAMFGENWRARLSGALKRAAARKAWLIAFTHDISDAPSPWGTRGGDLDALITEAHSLGFAAAPVSEALELSRS